MQSLGHGLPECLVSDMRGADEQPGSIVSYVSLEARVPAGHPLRVVRRIAAVAGRGGHRNTPSVAAVPITDEGWGAAGVPADGRESLRANARSQLTDSRATGSVYPTPCPKALHLGSCYPLLKQMVPQITESEAAHLSQESVCCELQANLLPGF